MLHSQRAGGTDAAGFPRTIISGTLGGTVVGAGDGTVLARFGARGRIGGEYTRGGRDRACRKVYQRAYHPDRGILS